MSSIEDRLSKNNGADSSSSGSNIGRDSLNDKAVAAKVRKMDRRSDVSVDKKQQQQQRQQVGELRTSPAKSSESLISGANESQAQAMIIQSTSPLDEFAASLVDKAIGEAESELSVHERYQLRAQSSLDDASTTNTHTSNNADADDEDGGEL